MTHISKTYIFLLLCAAAATTPFVSCQTDDDELFSQNASERLQSTINEVKQVLLNSEYGWELEYYPGEELEYGGIVYTVQFESLKASVSCSLLPDSTQTTYYRITNDNGPVLTFDTYNDLLHYYSTPSGSEYEAKGGEYEFVIKDIADTLVTLYGKKTHNNMYLRKLKAPVNEYAEKTIANSDNFIQTFEGTEALADVTGFCQLSNKTIAFVQHHDTIATAYTYNDRGIRLYRPLRVGGVNVQTFDYDIENHILTCTDEGAEHIVLQGYPQPDNIIHFKDYEGAYTLRYNNNTQTMRIELKPNRLDGTYRLHGFSSKYEVVLNYDHDTGQLILAPQILGDIDGKTVYLCSYDSSSSNGGIWTTPEASFSITWNGNIYYPAYNFAPTLPKLYKCTSIVLITVTTNADGDAVADLVNDSDWLVNNSPLIANLGSLLKLRN